MGVFAEPCVAKYGFTPRAHGPVRHRLHHAPKRQRGRQLRLGDRARDRPGKDDDTVIPTKIKPFKAKLDKIPGHFSRVQEGRHDHRGHLVEHLRPPVARGAGAAAAMGGGA